MVGTRRGWAVCAVAAVALAACGNVRADGDSGAIDAGADAAPIQCVAPRQDCGVGACVDTNNDSAHCGECGVPCDVGEVCARGACAPACPIGEVACGTSCVNLDNNDAHCGSCDHPCDEGEVCGARSCVAACLAGEEPCAGGCVDLASDENHCGGCGMPCARYQTCVTSACVTPSLPTCDNIQSAPYTSCGTYDGSGYMVCNCAHLAERLSESFFDSVAALDHYKQTYPSQVVVEEGASPYADSLPYWILVEY